ncbi:uncharacterized protein LOC133792455 [Humulus lupulus]|uniref:uncharacterized protein LOC133792455 n=1 Tax=Humulus lupulus TaxID=3486 RepID=UPI002B417D11|nr:uncharacterized protein LOC133792455 [Humulus lupulus]
MSNNNQEEDTAEDFRQPIRPNLQMQALLGEMRRMMRAELEPIHERSRNREPPVDTWEEMKILMRKRFVPSHYYRGLYQKLQRLNQGSKSVDEYYKEMKVAMIQANVEEDREATMARFLHGLNREIADIVELQHYVELTDMVHQAIKVEEQLKRKGLSRRGQPMATTSLWKTAPKRDEQLQNNPKFELSNAKPMTATTLGNAGSSTSKTRDIKCFKCQGWGHIASQCVNKRVMVINAQGELESKNEEEVDGDAMPPLEDADDEQNAVVGDSLVARRVLNVQIKEEESNQRENLFHTRCFVNNKFCSVIIDGGSCTNVASTYLVEKLALTTLKHPHPYRLQWLNDCGEIKVTRQVLVALSIGKYEDEVLCDVVPMHACHLLFGRPWQYDLRVTHDGFTNRYSFTLKRQPITLVPLTPKQEALLCTNDLAGTLPSDIVYLLQEFEDVLPEGVPYGLPPIRGIEHQINFTPSTSIPNRLAYRSNPEETKELQKQVGELLEKGLDDMLDELHGSCVFTKIDLKSGYHHIRMKEGDEWKTAFNTKYGLYECKNLEEHVMHLKSVLEILRKERLFANLKKCTFCTNKLVFLGFVVSKSGIEVDEKKVKAIQVVARINDNAYKLDLPGDDLRTNPSQEGENDANQRSGHADHTCGNGAGFTLDPLSLPSGPITRLRAKRFKEALNGLIQENWADSKKTKMGSNNNQGLVHVIKASEEANKHPKM